MLVLFVLLVLLSLLVAEPELPACCRYIIEDVQHAFNSIEQQELDDSAEVERKCVCVCACALCCDR